MQAQIFDDPLIAQVDPATYDAFVGQYELTPGMGDLITRQGDKLFGQDLPVGQEAPGVDRTELLPESPDTFFIRGDPTRMTFLKDQSGKVIRLVLHFPDREIVREKKIR
jgi:hypothetical protein